MILFLITSEEDKGKFGVAAQLLSRCRLIVMKKIRWPVLSRQTDSLEKLL